MKMISSTSITSTSGTTLISASEVLTRRPRPRRPLLAAADGWTFGILGEIPLGDVQELHREVVHLRGKVLHAIRQMVVENHSRNRRKETQRRRDERFRDARRDRAEVRRARLRNAFECRHDAPHGAEQSDE